MKITLDIIIIMMYSVIKSERYKNKPKTRRYKMKNLSNEEISKKGKNYDNIQNEGGEGFNPYWSELERRDMEAAQDHAALPKSKEEQIDALNDRIRKECGSVAREWNEDQVDKKKAELYAEIGSLKKEIEVEFKAEWTEEITASRRIEWNNFVKSIINSKGQIDGKDQPKLYQKQINQGWKLEALKKAVAIYK